MIKIKKLISRFFILTVGIVLTAGCMHTKPDTSPTQAMTPLKSNYVAIPSTLSGSYLAGRFAQQQQDWDSAFHYMSQALALSEDAKHASLLDRTFLLALGKGEIEDATPLADKIIKRNNKADIAYIFKATLAVQDKDFTEAQRILNAINQEDFGSYTIPLLQAWVKAAKGDTKAALETLNTAKYGQDSVYILHKALIHDLAGQSNSADELYKNALQSGMTLHETLIVANYFERQGNKGVAEDIYDAIYNQDPRSPFVIEGYKRLKNDVTPENAIASAEDGLVFALFSMASLLYERQAYDSALIYCRLIENLQPNKGFINLMIGDILALSDHYNKAIDHYRKIERGDILFKMAQLRTVEVLERAGRTVEALDMLSVIADQEDMRLEALTYIGDIYQREQRYDLALEAYDQAIGTLGDNINPQHWGLIYARGMSYEQLNDWTAAEKDLLRALEYQPENPYILNYLGYSWVEKGIHLDRALAMIKKAVILKPDDGFIVDSYGWALYKNGQFKDAVYWLERAVEMKPEDAALNDHLGDAYWQVDREKEARFQWKRAYTLAKDTAKKSMIGQKLKAGLKKQPHHTLAENREAALHPPALKTTAPE